ncbi:MULTISPECIES: hypothetical protein [Bacillaceae]|uniref:Lipoprotein n=1 Tax=Alkalicoccobacillus plakortidis TaxID=444060 RepID=A0A9D5DM92_9BACI|nr:MULTISPECIES: hypothetical protein [Bacillaceae]KQL56552.1 hypothetical protein AN965_12550 [Alkalicoccobacillus plakortidis]
MKGTWFLLLLVGLAGCSDNRLSGDTLPEEQPEDFNFRLAYGVSPQTFNEINTIDGTFTKDLVTAGTETTSFLWAEEELAFFYQQFKQLNILDLPRQSKKASSPCSEPFHSYELYLIADEEKYTLSWDSSCSNKALEEWEGFMHKVHDDIIYPSEAYQSLPEAVGGYD